MRTKTLRVFLILVAPVAMGCTTLFAPGPDMVPVYSTPPGAVVTLDKLEVGRTPCIVAVPRSSEGIFTIQLAGYEPVTVDRDKVCNGLTALNLLGGWVTMPLFFAIDGFAGNIGKYSTKPIQLELKPVKRPPPPPLMPTDLPTPEIRTQGDPPGTPR
ncbi:MAG: PEGA domain-containing protein [Planctomycetes bacterium]|nr:PEGA domain-containing protein [Planctomycetota bacterium]